MAIIEVSGLVKRYGGVAALDGVSFSVPEGEIFGVLGPNGAGKTTAVECTAGLRRADAGRSGCSGSTPSRTRGGCAGRSACSCSRRSSRRTSRSGRRSTCTPPSTSGRGTGASCSREWGLAHRRDARFGRLSGGERQRLFIALALVGDPKVAFLDELTTGLDPQARRDTWDLIRQVRDGGVTVVLVSHFMDEVEELCDRVAVLDRGRVVAVDTPTGLIDGAGGGHRVRFRPLTPLDDALLTALPEVIAVSRDGDQVTVTGTGDVATAVTGALARGHVLVADLRIDRRTLDDAFIALTGRSFQP